MKAFRVAGLYSPKGKNWYKFTKELVAENDDEAIEKTYSLLGSKYGIKRRLIKIENVDEIDPKDAEDPVVRYVMRDSNE